MDIEGGNQSVHAELDEIYGMFKFALVRDEPVARKNALHLYFKTMRDAHTNGQLDDADLTWRLNDWKKGVKELFLVSSEDALVVTSQTLKACQEKEQMPVADKLIINTVCDLINICARPALLAHANRAGSFNLGHSAHYINHVKNVLFTTAPHYDSASFQLTYRDAITEFKKILFGSSSAPELPTNLFLVPPASRYQHVKQVHDWAKAQHPRCSALLGEMQEILFASTILDNGQEIILHPKEAVADEWGREHYVAESNAAILELTKEDLQKEEQAKPKLVTDTVAGGAEDENYGAVEDELFELFQQVAQNPDNAFSYAYLLRRADNLADVSLKHVFQLSARCVYAIEEQGITSEKLQETIYGFAVSAIANWEIHTGGDYSQTHKLNLEIMKRSSAFQQSDQAEDIFEFASISYREYLGSITPVQRYDEVFAISEWLGEQAAEHEMLGEFVDDLLNYATQYGRFLGIPLEEDTRPLLWEVSGNQPS